MAKRRKRNKKWISWLIILVLLIGAGVVCYMVWDSYFRDKSEPDSSETENSGKDELDKEKSNDELLDGQKVKQYDGDDPNKAQDLSGAITYAGVNGDELMIRVNIDQFLDDGKCELTLVRSGVTVYSSVANIVGGAMTSTCEGFDVAAGELGEGNIEINIKISADERAGLIRGEVNI